MRIPLPGLRRATTAATAALTAGLLLAGCGSPDPADSAKRPSASASAKSPSEPTGSASSSASASASASAEPGAAGAPARAGGQREVLRKLDALPVKGRAPKTGYQREQFGSPWADTDSNHCRTRDDILKRDLTRDAFRSDGCTITSGRLADPYTGRTIDFERGHSRIDIDHVVALSNAWQTGAFRWPQAKRVALANDPLNLLASDASANRRKGDGDTATWLPPNKSFRPQYVARQVAVKAKYELWVTAAEKAAMRRVLTGPGGPDVTLPKGGSPTLAPDSLSRSEPRSSSSAAPRNSAPPRKEAAPAGDILSPSGKHYRVGQYCAARHRGLSTRDASGRTIRCAPQGDRLRWQG